MSLVTDADVPIQMVTALKAVGYDFFTLDDLNIPIRPDEALMGGLMATPHRVLVTMDTGIPSQAYLYEYAARGITIVVLRWKQRRPEDFQAMLLAILAYGAAWEARARETPSVISVTASGWRARAWTEVPGAIADSARAKFGEPS